MALTRSSGRSSRDEYRIAGASLCRAKGMIAHVMVMIFPFAMAFAAASDLLTMTIPNKLSLALLGGFLVLAPVAGMPWHEVLAHLGAGAGVLVAGIVLFALGWLGGGDAKLLAVASLWIGPALLLPFLCIVAVLGGGLALVILAYRRMPAGALPLPGWAARLHIQGSAIPYGVAIAAAALAIYPSTVWYATVSH
jgi:prepilin peptidase CpaA